MTTPIATWTEQDLAAYLDTYLFRNASRQLASWFRAVVTSVTETATGQYSCRVRRPGSSTAEGPYPCVTPGFQPVVGQEVECVWKDASAAYVMLPVSGVAPPWKAGDLKWSATADLSYDPDWLLCDGSTKKISDYPRLFAAIGITYGGDGVATFALPPAPGRVPVVAGAGTNLTSRAIGDMGGAETHVLTAAEMPSHSHSHSHGGQTDIQSANHSHVIGYHGTSGSYGTVDSGGASSSGEFWTQGQSNDHHHDIGGDATTAGGGGTHENMPPFLALALLIHT